MDPELARVAAGFPVLDLGDLAAARAAFAGVGEQSPPAWFDGVEATELEVDGVVENGAPPVRVRVYVPRGTASVRSGILYLHGGSFVIGDLDTSHVGCGAMAAATGAVVVNVGYRLAPETPFPGAIEDAYAVLCWLAGPGGGEFGVDPAAIAIAGSSAGAGLAAGLALLARDRGGPALAFQMLSYPVLDDRLDSVSARTVVDGPIVTRADLEHAWRYYLQDAHDGATSQYAAPARATDLAGLPPAFVLACAVDPLRDEALHYAGRLTEAGVAVELHMLPGTIHGFDVMPGELGDWARASQHAALRRALVRAPAGAAS